MRSLFKMGITGEPWRAPLNQSNLGQGWDVFGSIATSLLTAAPALYSAYQAREMAKDAEDAREAAEAAKAAALATAEAEKAAAQRKLDEEKKQQMQVQQAGAQGQILGIPKEYALYGGLGLGAIGLVALVVSLVK